jgi:hypothetical protein
MQCDQCTAVAPDVPGGQEGWAVVTRDEDGNAIVVLCPDHAEV